MQTRLDVQLCQPKMANIVRPLEQTGDPPDDRDMEPVSHRFKDDEGNASRELTVIRYLNCDMDKTTLPFRDGDSTDHGEVDKLEFHSSNCSEEQEKPKKCSINGIPGNSTFRKSKSGSVRHMDMSSFRNSIDDSKTLHNLSHDGESERLTIGDEEESGFLSPTDSSDLRLVVEGRGLYVSRVVLSLVSPVLKNLFESQSRDQRVVEIPLDGENFADFLEFLCCVYPDVLRPVDENNVTRILPLVEKYEVARLKVRCQKFLIRQCQCDILSAETLVRNIRLSVTHEMEKLWTMCLDRASNFESEKLESIKDFNDLSEETISGIFRRRLKMYERACKKINTKVREAETHCNLYHKSEIWGNGMCKKCYSGVGKVSVMELKHF